MRCGSESKSSCALSLACWHGCADRVVPLGVSQQDVVCARKRERERVCVCVCARARARIFVFVCVCVCVLHGVVVSPSKPDILQYRSHTHPAPQPPFRPAYCLSAHRVLNVLFRCVVAKIKPIATHICFGTASRGQGCPLAQLCICSRGIRSLSPR